MKTKILFLPAFLITAIALANLVLAQSGSVLHERGWNYEIWKNPDGSFTYKTGGIPLWAYDYSKEKYVPYVFEDKGSYIRVANGLIGADIYSDYSVFYETNRTEVRVKNETWVLEKFNRGWKQLQLQFVKTDIFKNSTGIFPTKVYKVFSGENLEGELNMTFAVRENRPLEHIATYKGSAGIYRLRQLWEGNSFTYAKFMDGKERALSTITSLTGNEIPENSGTKRLAFLDRKGYMLISEDLTSARDKVIAMNVDNKKKDIEFVYGTWSINSGESFVLDPATFSSNNPTEDSEIYTDSASGTACPTTANARGSNLRTQIGDSDLVDGCIRIYVEWDITSITDGADVTDTVFKFDIESVSNPRNCDYNEINTKPSTATVQGAYDDIGDGTTFVDNDAVCTTAGDNKLVDLGTSADTDVEAQLTSNWWAVGAKLDNEVRESVSDHQVVFEPEEDLPTPAPTLEVTYTLPNAVPRFADNNTYQNTTRSATNTYTYSSSLNISASINITDPNGDAQLETVIIQVNGTNITNKKTTDSSFLGSGLRIYNKSLGGQYYVNFTSLAAGTYVALWWVNDSSNGQNQSTNFTITINRATPTITLTPTTSTITYSATTDEACSSTNTDSTEANNYYVNVTNGTIYSLVTPRTGFVFPGGVSTGSCDSPQTANYSQANSNFTITVNKGGTLTQMFLNGTRADKSYKINRAANFTATVNVSGLTVNIDTNITGWNVQSGTDFVTNVSTLTSTGRFNITGYFTTNTNYSASIETFYATVGLPDPSPGCFNSTRVNNFFICSYDDSEFSPAKTSGIFYAGRKSDFISLCNDAAYSEYVFNVTGAQAFKAIIPFASATCNTIGNQTSIIEKQGLPSRPFGSYALTGPAKLQLSLKYDRILINGTDRFGSGQHKICIQKIGRQGSNALVDVRTC